MVGVMMMWVMMGMRWMRMMRTGRMVIRRLRRMGADAAAVPVNRRL